MKKHVLVYVPRYLEKEVESLEKIFSVNYLGSNFVCTPFAYFEEEDETIVKEKAKSLYNSCSILLWLDTEIHNCSLLKGEDSSLCYLYYLQKKKTLPRLFIANHTKDWEDGMKK